MLSSAKFVVKSDCFKVDSNMDMRDYVVSLVRNTEMSRLTEKDSFKKGKALLESEHAEVDVMTVDENTVNQCLKKDAGQWLKDREELIALKKECEKCLPIEKVTALKPVDRVHITLMARAIYKNVNLDNAIFDTDKGGVDISKAISVYYKTGKMKDLKDALRSVFQKLLGTEGDYFYAIKTRKSDFEESDLRNFLATFGGSAKRECVKKTVDGKEVKSYMDFNYVDKSNNKKLQVSAFTTLCAVVLDNPSKHEVIKPHGITKDKESGKLVAVPQK